MAKPTTPALRRRRTLRNLVLLLLCPLALTVLWQFPYFTSDQALWALKKENFFESGRVLFRAETAEWPDYDSLGDEFVVLRSGDWYALGSLVRNNLFWGPYVFWSIRPEPDRALACTQNSNDFLFVVSSDPEIVTVEVEYLSDIAEQGEPVYALRTIRREALVENCFLLPLEELHQTSPLSVYSGGRLRGYDAAGNLVYQEPVPEIWARYGVEIDGMR